MSRYAAILALFLLGCETSRPEGRCIGAFEEKEPGMKYEYSTQNIVVGAILVETIIVPAIVVLKEIQCPLPRKKPAP